MVEVLLAVVMAAASGWNLPFGFPQPHIAPRNPMTAEKRELGRHLFYDSRLSANGTQSCASCHQQRHAFTDSRPTAVGSTGQLHSRNTQTLTNVAYNASFTWSNAGMNSLEAQALVPMFNQHPIELGVRGHERVILERFREDEGYRTWFRRAFPGERQPVTIRNIARALATFERSLISGRSPYDRMVWGGEDDALSPAAARGMKLFASSRLACSQCHAGFNFSGPVRYVGGRKSKPALVSNGVTHGEFRVPTLRNVELTAPYMHDGSIATLDEVIDRYSSARRLDITSSEKADLIEFLKSLTDWNFVTDSALSPPGRGGRSWSSHAGDQGSGGRWQ